jgi:hypothetical protein
MKKVLILFYLIILTVFQLSAQINADFIRLKKNNNLATEINSPELTIGDITVDDSYTGDNDGILDPGETVYLMVEISNQGAANVTNIYSTLEVSESSSSYITVDGSAFGPNSLNIGASITTFFSATANASTPEGTAAELIFNCYGGNSFEYYSTSSLDIIIGVFPEFLISQGGTITTCFATLFDSGGETGNYQNSENYTITFLPGTSNKALQVDFVSFNLESDDDCGYDYLSIYNGSSTASPLIGKYC